MTEIIRKLADKVWWLAKKQKVEPSLAIDLDNLPPELAALVGTGAQLSFSAQRVRCGCGSGLTGHELNEHLNSACPSPELFGSKEEARITL